jgi:hypothetical protein
MRKRWILIICIIILIAIAVIAVEYRLPPAPVVPTKPAPVPTYPINPNPIAPTSTSPTTSSLSPIIITTADNGSTITLHKGDRFTLELGEQNWTVSLGDQSIIRRLPNFAMIRGAQGIYQALAAGTTTLSATGRPICNPGMACPMYIIEFKVNIVVS